jgi:hypothetical protein
MAHLWMQAVGGWEAQKLDGAQFDLAALSGSQSGEAKPSTTTPKAARLIQTNAGGSRKWALAVSPDFDIRVNGRTVLAGLCVLVDRDEIRIGRRVQYFFSTESLALVEEFPSLERPVFCGRCRQKIDVGLSAVRCPGCGVWYNQSAELPCWTYADKCTFCGHPTALDAGFSWIPEE